MICVNLFGRLGWKPSPLKNLKNKITFLSLPPQQSSIQPAGFPSLEQGLKQGDDITHSLSACNSTAQEEQASLSHYRWKNAF